MKASELRIGNYIENTDSQMASYMVVNADVIKQNEHTMYASLEPIPLTEEWLLKFGFEFHVNANCENFYYTKDAFICIRCDEDFEWFRYYNGDFYSEIEYVHQLQNLFFCLCGKELTLKS